MTVARPPRPACHRDTPNRHPLDRVVIPQPTPIYHITHIENLPLIVADDRLRCCADLRLDRVGYRDIAHGHIQDRRARTVVPCGPRGLLHEYVPFYFAPRSPMLYAISQGSVASYAGGQETVVHLVSDVQALVSDGQSFVFTDGHATIMASRFFEHASDLRHVDWTVMPLTYWNDTPTYPDRKRRRQAELLIHRFFPWDLVTEIGVMTQAMRQRTETALQAASHRPLVTVRRRWYY